VRRVTRKAAFRLTTTSQATRARTAVIDRTKPLLLPGGARQSAPRYPYRTRALDFAPPATMYCPAHECHPP
ncbi:MAG: hypothetical protein ACK528_11210, partial [Alphaproteobacteria bacterium]